MDYTFLLIYRLYRIADTLLFGILTILYCPNVYNGDSDVGDFMMVTDFRCWWQNHYYVVDFFRYVGDFLNVLYRSPISCIGHQHPESVTNISNLSPTHLVSNIRYQHRCNFYVTTKNHIKSMKGIPSLNFSSWW